MKVDKRIFIKTAESFSIAGKGALGPWRRSTEVWSSKQYFPEQLKNLFKTHIPKVEIGAGAGALFDELRIIRWNDDFPEALKAKLLIVGTAPNGDHIVVDLKTGATGYMSHEHDWQSDPREFFIAVSDSLGNFLRDINSNPSRVPDDYWDARSGRN